MSNEENILKGLEHFAPSLVFLNACHTASDSHSETPIQWELINNYPMRFLLSDGGVGKTNILRSSLMHGFGQSKANGEAMRVWDSEGTPSVESAARFAEWLASVKADSGSESGTLTAPANLSASPTLTTAPQAVSPQPEPNTYYAEKMARQKIIHSTINFYRKCIPIDVGDGFLLAISDMIEESGESGLRLQLKIAAAARDSVVEKLRIWFQTGYAWMFGKPV